MDLGKTRRPKTARPVRVSKKAHNCILSTWLGPLPQLSSLTSVLKKIVIFFEIDERVVLTGAGYAVRRF